MRQTTLLQVEEVIHARLRVVCYELVIAEHFGEDVAVDHIRGRGAHARVQDGHLETVRDVFTPHIHERIRHTLHREESLHNDRLCRDGDRKRVREDAPI